MKINRALMKVLSQCKFYIISDATYPTLEQNSVTFRKITVHSKNTVHLHWMLLWEVSEKEKSLESLPGFFFFFEPIVSIKSFCLISDSCRLAMLSNFSVTLGVIISRQMECQVADKTCLPTKNSPLLIILFLVLFAGTWGPGLCWFAIVCAWFDSGRNIFAKYFCHLIGRKGQLHFQPIICSRGGIASFTAPRPFYLGSHFSI